ncbi:MFS transporter [Candidatus Roizmanbacteria bacterium]|nr:MFS transporter [Candidatus Roizmanbacteria bacterium]
MKKLTTIARLYLFTQFFRSLYFSWPIWYGFATKTLTPLQVGIFFGLLGFVQLLAEIPSGAFADRYGRKLCAIIGSVVVLVGPLCIYFGHNFTWYLLTALFYGAGRAFLNGTLDSLLYDHPTISKQEYRRVNKLNITIFQTGLIFSAAVGGFLYAVHPSFPFLAEVITGCICLMLILFIDEGRNHTITNIQEPYLSHFGNGLKHLVATKQMQLLVFMGVPYAVMLSICVDYLNEAAMIEHGFAPSTRGVLIAGMKIFTLIILNIFFFRWFEQDTKRIVFLAIGSVLTFTLLSLNFLSVFVIGYIVWNILVATQTAFFNPILHDNLPSSHRATAIGSYNALISLVEFGVSTGIGFLVQWFHTPRFAYGVFAVISFFIILPCGIMIAKNLTKNQSRVQLISPN